MTDTYRDLLKMLIDNGKYKNQMLMIENVTFEGKLEFVRDPEVEKWININIDKKIKYIKKTYHTGKITRKNPCIESINGNEVVFRSARAFPTLYIDLIVLSKKYKYCKITFRKIFIGYNIIGLNEFNTLRSKCYDLCLSHWQERFKEEKLGLEMLENYRRFYNERKNL